MRGEFRPAFFIFIPTERTDVPFSSRSEYVPKRRGPMDRKIRFRRGSVFELRVENWDLCGFSNE